MPDSSSPQRTASSPPLPSAAPTIAPVSACVVDTGRPVADANSTQTDAPSATANGNNNESRTSAPTSEEVKTVTSRTEMTTAREAPAAVQTVPHTSARRYVVCPLPASVAMPFDTSFAPLAKASAITAAIDRMEIVITRLQQQVPGGQQPSSAAISTFESRASVTAKLPA